MQMYDCNLTKNNKALASFNNTKLFRTILIF
jgi:hypothetical protein